VIAHEKVGCDGGGFFEFKSHIPPYFRVFRDNPGEAEGRRQKAKGKRQKASAVAEAMADREG
jgi:hypothetical protein